MPSPSGLAALSVVLREEVPWQVEYLNRLVNELGEQNAGLEDALANSQEEVILLRGRVIALSRVYRQVDAEYDTLREAYEHLASIARDAWHDLQRGAARRGTLADLEDLLRYEGPLLLPRPDVNMEGIITDESDGDMESDNDSDGSGMYD
jgi:hypothetical protein